MKGGHLFGGLCGDGSDASGAEREQREHRTNDTCDF